MRAVRQAESEPGIRRDNAEVPTRDRQRTVSEAGRVQTQAGRVWAEVQKRSRQNRVTVRQAGSGTGRAE